MPRKVSRRTLPADVEEHDIVIVRSHVGISGRSRGGWRVTPGSKEHTMGGTMGELTMSACTSKTKQRLSKTVHIIRSRPPKYGTGNTQCDAIPRTSGNIVIMITQIGIQK